MENRDIFIEELIDKIIKPIVNNEEFDINHLKFSEKFFKKKIMRRYL